MSAKLFVAHPLPEPSRLAPLAMRSDPLLLQSVTVMVSTIECFVCGQGRQWTSVPTSSPGNGSSCWPGPGPGPGCRQSLIFGQLSCCQAWPRPLQVAVAPSRRSSYRSCAVRPHPHDPRASPTSCSESGLLKALLPPAVMILASACVAQVLRCTKASSWAPTPARLHWHSCAACAHCSHTHVPIRDPVSKQHPGGLRKRLACFCCPTQKVTLSDSERNLVFFLAVCRQMQMTRSSTSIVALAVSLSAQDLWLGAYHTGAVQTTGWTWVDGTDASNLNSCRGCTIWLAGEPKYGAPFDVALGRNSWSLA
jgi:hypothetical protein